MHESKQQKVLSQRFTRRAFLSTSLKAGAATFTTALLPNLRVKAEGQYNVLFIIVDDLRPLLGCYGHLEMHTPNIDRIAQRGTLFNRAYCQNPLCHPSRTSILTGLRPNTTRVFSNSAGFRENLPNAVTLPQHFKTSGYHTQSIGKVAQNLERQDDDYSWSTPSWTQPSSYDARSTVPSWQALDVEDEELRDGRTAKRTIEVLEEIQNKRFFLAVGFRKPHLPFYAPRKYYELYNDVTFNLPSSSDLPNNAPFITDGNFEGFRDFKDIPDEGPLSEAKTLELIQAYAASTSFTDAQVGRVLNHLDVLRLTENTVIVLVGDHGFHLGEHGKWLKNTLFEVCLRSPLIVSVPGQTYQGVKTDALVELVDIYPTLCDTCQLPIPLELEGISLVPVIEQPTRSWKTAAFSQKGSRTGNSIRTDQYRYTEWGYGARNGIELYDYHADPNETVNIANLPENSELVAELSEQLHAGWQRALPDTHQLPMPRTLRWDINNDGIIDIQDLLIIASNFGTDTPENSKVDVNKDGKINIIDLLIVATHIGESTKTSAPKKTISLPHDHIDKVEKWLSEAYQADDGSDVFQNGIANLEAMINNLTPEKTVLLPNYPNPFNPETWIPYDLAQDTNVHVDIYNLKGKIIRTLNIGYQHAGTYRTKGRAVYWDGRNSYGEPVSNGVYFYSLNTQKTKAIRQMVILK